MARLPLPVACTQCNAVLRQDDVYCRACGSPGAVGGVRAAPSIWREHHWAWLLLLASLGVLVSPSLKQWHPLVGAFWSASAGDASDDLVIGDADGAEQWVAQIALLAWQVERNGEAPRALGPGRLAVTTRRLMYLPDTLETPDTPPMGVPYTLIDSVTSVESRGATPTDTVSQPIVLVRIATRDGTYIGFVSPWAEASVRRVIRAITRQQTVHRPAASSPPVVAPPRDSTPAHAPPELTPIP